MIKHYKIFEKEQYCMNMMLEDDKFDYYSDVEIKFIIRETEYIIYKDNLLFLKNIINNFKDKNKYLDDDLDEDKLGILLNIYYKTIYDELEDDRISINEFNEWIGEKYVLFLSKIYVTWLYEKQDNYVIKITPIFNNDEYGEEFEKFLLNYKDILCMEIHSDDLNKIFNVLLDIIKLYFP